MKLEAAAAAAALLLFVAGLDCQTFLDITIPKKIPSNMTEDGLGEDESTQTYIITIKKKTYIIHLQQQTFLPNDFWVYTYNRGGFVHPSSPHIQGECFYQGYIQGFPNSVAILSTCHGLRGLLQFENVSYGVEHLKDSANFEHLIYQINNKNLQSLLRREDLPSTERQLGSEGMPYKLLSDNAPLSDVTKVHRYIEVYIVLDKGLYNFLGGSKEIVTDSIAQLIGFVNSMFSSLNITVVLSSLEFWTDHNKISTSGEPDVLLRKFLRWKNSYLVLRPHDLALLLVLSSGIKAFSSCSIEDFQYFIKFRGAHCLSNRPNLKLFYKKRSARSRALCGNGVLEAGEKCDCGSEEECKYSKCCTSSCTFLRGAVCSNELCCENCQFKPRNTICRAAIDSVCDFPEYCNGSSASCPSNVYTQNGYSCASNSGYCYGGSCQSADLQCQDLFGEKSKSAPQACYEEINGETDRFGHCGIDIRKGFKTCSLRDIKCGKLICLYPTRNPYVDMDVPVLYIPFQDTLCISLDLQQPEGFPDPMLVKEGTKCGTEKVCLKQVCEKYDVLKYDCDPTKTCLGHGICNNKRNCHCDPGWAPPNCKEKGGPLGGSIDSGLRMLASDITERAIEDNMRTWVLLSIFLFLPIVVGSAVLIVKWARISNYFIEDSGSLGDSDSYTRSDEYSMSDKTSLSNREDTT
ncbi:disintegrin and metalloproteinase domain-containing protein 2-like isoform X4 [Podarcis raffonei]|uniref:disintegrin and metalloproteinase domain-containing protein 2-like isoform X4 n=1 Tax=Podarcis raffonei TaxID=65483 RepID=UPI00232921F2|nr:disintegrin and metalloproteinase domain-containing protein 2-like isoform X4 [Podarcis raffonei]